MKKDANVSYSNAKLFSPNYMTLRCIGADHTQCGDQIISGKLFFSIEKFRFSRETKDKIDFILGENNEQSVTGKDFVKELNLLVGCLINDLSEIFSLTPSDSVLREISLKLFFENRELVEKYETERKAGVLSEELFTVSMHSEKNAKQIQCIRKANQKNFVQY
ncbi:hypothetical protein BLA29_010479 [Euroglyphus maynei]|uniref:Uncharacterized protein n=1 Tax=Euroglyphus maynei TaxID=6958 RepID=A0A1Y3B300_EURMA|nr:hypothetical protein BLA29_010479 [Euroglyphus maynei]